MDFMESLGKFVVQSIIKIGLEYGIKWISDYITKSQNDSRLNEAFVSYWVSKDDLESDAKKLFEKSLAIQNFKKRLADKKDLETVYHDFIISIAMELREIEADVDLPIKIGTAVLDNCFESDSQVNNTYRDNFNVSEAKRIISDRERLYKEYFGLFNDKVALDVIRIYYPANGKSWVEYNNENYIDIHVDLNKGTDYGFCIVGFAYARVLSDSPNSGIELLKAAYIKGSREMLVFDEDDLPKDAKLLYSS